MLLYTLTLDSPLGIMGVVTSDTGVVAVQMRPDDPGAEAWLRHTFPRARFRPGSHPVGMQAARQLEEYFAGRRRQFDVPLDLAGSSPFQQRVWAAVQAIPYGETATYGEVAHRVGSGPRAVGGAVGQNRVSIFIPCHRVVAAGGLGGYGGQEHLKLRLLRLEGNRLF